MPEATTITGKVVMISSTALDLPEHREQARLACERAGFAPHDMMEHLTARNADAVEASLEMVEQADVYVGIFAKRYGYIPDGHDISITEMEYNHAVELKKPRLIFFNHDDHLFKSRDFETGPGAAKLQSLKDRIGKERVVAFFKSPDDLRAHLVEALTSLAKDSNTVLSEDPGILHVESPFFSQYRSKVPTVIDALFPGERHYFLNRASSSQFVKSFSYRPWDIVHVDAIVEGDKLMFSRDDTMTHESINPLLSLSKAQLVVLSACNSFELGSSLAVSSVIAAQGNVDVAGYEEWASLFYELLCQGKSLQHEVFPAVKGAASRRGTSISLLSRRDFRISVC